MTYTRLAVALALLGYGFCVFLAVIGFEPMVGFVVTVPVLAVLIALGNLLRGSRDPEDEGD